MKQFFMFLLIMFFIMSLNQSARALGTDLKTDSLYAAEHGDSESQYVVGIRYQHGLDGFEQNLDLAERWYLRAIRQGHSGAMIALANIYQANAKKMRTRYEVDKMYAQALGYFQEAAYKGSVIAKFELGVTYYKGIGVDNDIKIAKMYFNEAINAPQFSFETSKDREFYTNLAKSYLTKIEALKLKDYIPLLENQMENVKDEIPVSGTPVSTAPLITRDKIVDFTIFSFIVLVVCGCYYGFKISCSKSNKPIILEK